MLSALQCKQAITTNYDTLYELACRAVARSGESDDKVVAVLPTSYPGPDQRWLLKMHGSVDEPASIVLTRADFAGYDGASRPAGAVLQAVLLTTHLLVVGTSMTDDNVLRLVHEVVQYRKRSKKKGGQDAPLGTVLDVSGSTLRRRLYEGMFRWCALPGASVFERALNLEVFLDCVAMYASDNLTWLLDVRFADLLDEETSALAEDLRSLVARMPSTGEWAEVRAALQAYGAA
nr:SIR2 family protein [Auraticoccus cholistanensis]